MHAPGFETISTAIDTRRRSPPLTPRTYSSPILEFLTPSRPSLLITAFA